MHLEEYALLLIISIKKYQIWTEQLNLLGLLAGVVRENGKNNAKYRNIKRMDWPKVPANY